MSTNNNTAFIERALTARSFIIINLLASSMLAVACSGTTLNPTHYGKYEFEGQVKTEEGKPVAGAWVKVRNWETLTDEQGHWKEEQILHCGAITDQMSGFDEEDAVLVTAPGYVTKEEKFKVLHPAWFGSCKSEEKIVFETVLTTSKKAKTSEEKKVELPQGNSTYL
jgi:hypothetical protein